MNDEDFALYTRSSEPGLDTYVKNYLPVGTAFVNVDAQLLGFEPRLTDMERWIKPAPATTLDMDNGLLGDSSFPSMLDPEETGLVGIKDICGVYGQRPCDVGFPIKQVGLGSLGDNPAYKAPWEACNKKQQSHWDGYYRLVKQSQAEWKAEGQTDEQHVAKIRYHEAEYKKIMPKCKELYNKWKEQEVIDGKVVKKPGEPSMDWPTWEFKWKSYTFPKAPELTGTTKAINNLASVPDFFKNTVIALNKTLAFPEFKPPVKTLAFPAISTPAVYQLSSLSITLTDLTAKLNLIKRAIRTSELAKLRAAYTTITTAVKKIKDTSKPSISTVLIVPAVVKLYKVMGYTKDLAGGLKSWFSANYNITTSAFTAIQAFMDETINIFTTLPTKLNASFKSVVSKIKGAVKSAISSMTAAGAKYSTAIKDYVKAYVDYLKKYVGQVINAMKSWMDNVFRYLKGDMANMASWFTSRARDLGNGFKTDLTAVKNWFGAVSSGLSKNISGNVNAMGTEISTDMKQITDNFQKYSKYIKELVNYEFTIAIAEAKARFKVEMKGLLESFGAKIDRLEAVFKENYADLKAHLDLAKKEISAALEKVTKLTELVGLLSKKLDVEEIKFTKYKVSSDKKFLDLEAAISELRFKKPAPTQEREGWMARMFGTA